MEPLLVVNDLDAIGVLVQSPAVDDGAVLLHQAHWPIERHHLTARIDDRALNRPWAALRADVAQIRRYSRADAADTMTCDTAALALEDGAPARGIAALHVGRVEGIHVPQIGGNTSQLGVVERERRHPCRGRAGPDEARQLRIGRCIAE